MLIPPSQPDPDTQLNVPQPGSRDRSALESPITKIGASSVVVGVGTIIPVTVTHAVNSGEQLNGAPVYGVLAAPVRTAQGPVLDAGTRVVGTVVSSARAGQISSFGELSVQLTRVGAAAVVTDVLDFDGQPGKRDVADAAPAKGSEARIDPGAQLVFHVMETGNVPGIVPGIPPAKNAGADAGKDSGGTNSASPGGQDQASPNPGLSPAGRVKQSPGVLQGVSPPAMSAPPGQPR